MQIAIIGAPGSGKTTQADLLAKHLHVPAISIGEMLRELTDETGPKPEEAKTALAKGELVSEELALELLRKRLLVAETKRGFILDGMPRTLGEARAMETMFAFKRVFHLKASLEVVMERLIRRGREDDRQELITRRFEIYKEEIKSIINYYQTLGVLIEIDVSRASPQEVNQKIVSKLQ